MNYYELKKRIINREPEDDISREWMIERLESHCRWKFDKALEALKECISGEGSMALTSESVEAAHRRLNAINIIVLQALDKLENVEET